MTVGVIPNTERDLAFAYTRKVCKFLSAQGITILLEKATAQAAGFPEAAVETEAVYRDAKFLTVLGGDGTILNVSHKAALYGTPMLGINLGTLGYLTDADKQDGLKALDKAIKGAYKTERRMMLAVSGETSHDGSLLALNDVCLSRGGFGKLITFSLHINGVFMDTLKADGAIIATPTGSTAYNLSAGGPILAPDGNMTVITVVCPHTLYNRPWVVNARDEITITAMDRHGAVLSLDGEPRLTLSEGASVTVKRSPCDAVILKTSDTDFFEILRRKMG